MYLVRDGHGEIFALKRVMPGHLWHVGYWVGVWEGNMVLAIKYIWNFSSDGLKLCQDFSLGQIPTLAWTNLHYTFFAWSVPSSRFLTSHSYVNSQKNAGHWRSQVGSDHFPPFFWPVGAPRRWKHAMAQVDVITVENSEQRDVVPNETQGCLDLKEKKPGLAGKGFGNCDWG